MRPTYESTSADGHCTGLRALVALSHGSSASSSAVQSQVPAEEACTSYGQVPGYGKLRADPVPATQAGDQRAGKEERCNVRAERMNRTDPPFSA